VRVASLLSSCADSFAMQATPVKLNQSGVVVCVGGRIGKSGI
jgi:hypothetical protein